MIDWEATDWNTIEYNHNTEKEKLPSEIVYLSSDITTKYIWTIAVELPVLEFVAPDYDLAFST